ncbi:MAG: hypothetical protein QOE63_1451 [Acidimicrobiaceae bacterium]
MTRPDLALVDLTVRFGGLVAVDNVSLHAPAGIVTGLIGPNGAGKTTTFNAMTGTVPTTSGSVRLGQHRLDGLSPARRAQLGLGRTFQRMELFDSMTVRENVTAGPEMRMAGRRSWTHLVSSRARDVQLHQRADAAIERCGIGDLASRNASDLSTGQRRLVELARAIASEFDFLLLDEPSSGLDPDETERFISILRSIVDCEGIGLLIVEHDMALVRALCCVIYVLDFGELLCHGPAAEVLSSDIVKAAYLGSDAVEAVVG